MDVPLDRRLDPLRFLAGTPIRLRILETLVAEPRTQDGLQTELCVPRTTLRRNLVSLEDRHWITEETTTNRYHVTAAGQYAVEQCSAVVDTVYKASVAGSFLAQFPTDLPVSADTLSDLEFTPVTVDDPHKPVSHVRRALANSTQLHGVVPVVNPAYVELVTDLVTDGLEFHVIASPTAVEAFRRTFDEAFTQLQDAESATLAVAPDIPEFGIAILDEVLLLATYDDRLKPHSVATVSRDGNHLETWILQQYRNLQETAEPIEDSV